ncbi:YbhB/YbcL family Raf kinase inhibitor-like protein [Phenylobacterium sp.]|uniref:YbhB/YbcL family Raf kinase inhibitor-like protein n=1 Tax=Phenylobacterium sp. TaxID=1871053 RepID=UPI003525A202
MGFALHSPAFAAGGAIPDRHLRTGRNLSPPLRWTDPPAGTRSFVLVVEDPNPPHGVVQLWAAHGINPDQTALREGVGANEAGIRQAPNDLGKPRYDGPQPPVEHGVYHYHFLLAALDVPELVVPGDATAGDVWEAAHPHLIERADLVGIVAPG